MADGLGFLIYPKVTSLEQKSITKNQSGFLIYLLLLEHIVESDLEFPGGLAGSESAVDGVNERTDFGGYELRYHGVHSILDSIKDRDCTLIFFERIEIVGKRLAVKVVDGIPANAVGEIPVVVPLHLLLTNLQIPFETLTVGYGLLVGHPISSFGKAMVPIGLDFS